MRRLADLEWIAATLQVQARTLAGQVSLLDAHVELLIDRLAERQDLDDTVAGVIDEPDVCRHEDDYRLDAGSMRAPLRFFCKACRRFVDPAQRSTPASPPRSPVDVPS